MSALIYRDSEWEHGMLCEFCDQPFRDGDEIHVNFLSMLDSGVPVMGDSMCPRCFNVAALPGADK